jgi:hypothetical protein
MHNWEYVDVSHIPQPKAAQRTSFSICMTPHSSASVVIATETHTRGIYAE